MAYKGFKGIGPNRYGSPLKQDPNRKKEVDTKSEPRTKGMGPQERKDPQIVEKGFSKKKIKKQHHFGTGDRPDAKQWARKHRTRISKEKMEHKEVEPLAAESVKLDKPTVKKTDPKIDTRTKYDKKLDKYESKKSKQYEKEIYRYNVKAKKEDEKRQKKAEKNTYKAKKKEIKDRYS